MPIISSSRPLYRIILRDALISAWHERRFWFIAFFAGILQTGGVYDAILMAVRDIMQNVPNLRSYTLMGVLESLNIQAMFSTGPAALASLGIIQGILLGALLVTAVLIGSILCQGALMYGLQRDEHGERAPLQECFAVSGKHIWSLIGLNAITLGGIWLARFFVTLPLSALYEFGSSWIGVLSGFILMVGFIFLTILLTALHIFSLNGIVLHEQSLYQALQDNLARFRRSWAVVIETAAALFCIGGVLLVVACGIILVAGFPLMITSLVGILFEFPTLLWISLAIGYVLFFGVLLLTGVYAITFQYAVWQHVYTRANHGNILAKVGRWLSKISHRGHLLR